MAAPDNRSSRSGGSSSSRRGQKPRRPGGPPARSAGGPRRGGPKGGSGKPGGRSSGGAPRKYSKGKPGGPARSRRDEAEPIPGNKEWGGLARKGAIRATHDERRDVEEARERRLRDDELDPEELAKREERQARRDERDRRTAELRAEAKAAVERTGVDKPKKKRAPRVRPALDRQELPSRPMHAGDEYEVLARMFGAPQAKKHMRKLRAAADAYEADRYPEARRALRPLVELAPRVAEIRELNGLILYRQGKYRDAAKELEEFRVLAASAEQNPVLMDCYRANQRWADVAELWTELSEVSPSAPAVNEGRIVMANAMAEQGDIDGAVKLLSKGWKRPSKPYEHHLRRAYALADLYERSGDAPRARALFEWLVAKAPEFVDAKGRLRNLR